MGAWWELYLFTLFRRLACEVEVHPAIPGVPRRPDFRVSCRSGSFFVEARHVAAGPVSGERVIGSDEWITGPLDDLSHAAFMVVVRIVQRSSERPARRAVTKGVMRWLDSLDPASTANEQPGRRDRLRQDAGGWVFELEPIAMPRSDSDDDRGLVAIYPGHGGFDNTVTALRAALKEKAGRYGRTGSPFVLAPLLTSGFAEDEDVVQALFGSEAVLVGPEELTEAQLVRRPDGFWVTPSGFRGTRISAVLVGKGVTPWTAAGPLPRLWMNPAAAHPLPNQLGLPAACVRDNGGLIFTDGDLDPHQVFGLPMAWPGPGKPFDA